MSDRRENMKKSLGISEYPWSSDDDDDTEIQGGEPQRTEPEVNRPSVADNPGTSGYQHITVPPLLCSFNSISSRRQPALTLRRTRDDVPLSLVSRQPHPPSSAASTASSDVQRILAFRKINRQPSSHRSRYNHLAQRHLNLQRIGANRGRDSTSLRRAQAIANMDFANPNLSVRHYHEALLCADQLVDAMRDYEPSPARTHAESAAAAQPAALGAPHDVIEALNARLHIDPNSEHAAPNNVQPVNLSHSDDGFLEADINQNENEMTAVDEAQDITMENDENDAPAEVEEGGEGGGSEEAGTGGEGGGDNASMSLEEVVEIDADNDAADTADTADNAPQGQLEEPVANTSSANEDLPIIQPHGLRRKRDSEDDNNDLGSVRELNQSLLRLLECPVCLEWMEPPMWQCRRGHLVCGRCRTRLAACPVCRTAFSSVRNRAMESVADLLRYPCRHGCARQLHLRRRATHEASCPARRYRCPAPACDARPPLPHRDLATHFQSKHLSMVKIGRSHKFSMRVNSEQHDNWIILALNQLFHLRVDVDIRTWGVVVYVAYIGPKCNADDYTYEVAVTGQHNSRKLVYTRATHCDLECSTLNVSRQDCFHLTLDQALNFLRVRNRHAEPDKYLHFSVAITPRVTANDEESN